VTRRRAAELATASAAAMIVLGVLSTALAPTMGVGTELLVSWIAILVGVAHALSAFASDRPFQLFGVLVVGLVYFVAGLSIAVDPRFSPVSLGLGLGVLFIAEGALRMVVYFRAPAAPGAEWIVFDCAKAFMLGVWIVGCWRRDELCAVGTIAGIEFIATGFAHWMLFAFGNAEAGPLTPAEAPNDTPSLGAR
jgi:uncharacterized membrane protein HdeD (DUF308 family)